MSKYKPEICDVCGSDMEVLKKIPVYYPETKTVHYFIKTWKCPVCEHTIAIYGGNAIENKINSNI